MIAVLSVTCLTALIPLFSPVIARLLNLPVRQSSYLFPILAASLFLVSFYLPDINISPSTATFQQHFVGGGVYSALLYIYFKRYFGWKLNTASSLLVLFAWVSALGVMNKLLEFAMAALHLMVLDMSDAYWDLLANTIGAIFVFVIVTIYEHLSAREQ